MWLPKSDTYTSAAPVIVACVVPCTLLNLVAIPAKPEKRALFVADIRISDGSPPSSHANCNADFKSASMNVTEVPSVGDATVPLMKPGVVPAVEPVANTRLVIHDSTPAVERAVAGPPAEDAWLRTIAYSMSRLSSLPAFISW